MKNVKTELKKSNGSKVIDVWIYMENSEKRVRQSGNIAQNLTLVTLTVCQGQTNEYNTTKIIAKCRATLGLTLLKKLRRSKQEWPE